MRNIVSVLAVAVLLAGIAPGQAWIVGPPSPFSYLRFDAEYFPGTAKVYFLGGRVGTSTTRPDIYSYTPATGTYAAVGRAMPRAVSNYDICLLRDNHDLPNGDTFGLYIVGGRFDAAPNYWDTLQVYYPVSNTAMIVPTDPFPGRAGGQITVAMSSIVYNNHIYTMGGFSQVSNAMSREVWCFDPLGTPGARWSRLADMPLPRAYPILAIVDSFLFACGGDTWNASGSSLIAKAEVFRLNLADTAAGWTTVASMPGINGEARGFGFDSNSPCEFAGKIIIAGRGTWSSESAHCYIYTVATNSWASFPSLNQRRRNHAGVFIPAEAGGTGVPGMWVFGGRQNADTNALTVSEYYPVTMTGIGGRPGAELVGVTLTPNPSRGSAVLRCSPQLVGARVQVFDVLGKSVWSGRAERTATIAGLPAGTYLVRIDAPGGGIERKFVVTR